MNPNREPLRPPSAPRAKRAFTLVGVLLPLVIILGLAGCGRKTEAAGPGGTSAPPVSPQMLMADGTVDLHALTKAVRAYGRRTLRVPKELNELVASKDLAAIPTPPAGQKYAINPRTLEVTLVNEQAP